MLRNSPGILGGVCLFVFYGANSDASRAGGRLSTDLIHCWSRPRRLSPVSQGLPDGSWYLYTASASCLQPPQLLLCLCGGLEWTAAVSLCCPLPLHAGGRWVFPPPSFPECVCPLAGYPLTEHVSAGVRGKANAELLQRVFKVSTNYIMFSFLFSYSFLSWCLYVQISKIGHQELFRLTESSSSCIQELATSFGVPQGDHAGRGGRRLGEEGSGDETLSWV